MQGHTYRFEISLSEEYKFVDDSCMLSHQDSGGQMVKEPLDCKQTAKGFTADWTCTVSACKNGERNSMELTLPLEDLGNCKCAPDVLVKQDFCVLKRMQITGLYEFVTGWCSRRNVPSQFPLLQWFAAEHHLCSIYN